MAKTKFINPRKKTVGLEQFSKVLSGPFLELLSRVVPESLLKVPGFC
jgi:hypothetical protein